MNEKVLRARYPYRLWEKHQKAGKQPSHTKKGPGRRHQNGKAGQVK